MVEQNMTHDELIIPNHPHEDQRNWEPEDDDEDRLYHNRFVQYLVRTFTRLRKWQRVHPDDIADLIFPHVPLAQIVEAHLYLEKVARCIDKKMQWKCAECGKDVWAKIKLTKNGLIKEHQYVRRDARYCSQSCRQKAFRKRKRVTANPPDTKAKPSPRDGYANAESTLAVNSRS
jgi:hypothetical protein